MLLAGALSAPALSHQIKSAISTVLFNANSGNLEVMHRFFLHDAEHAVKIIADKNADIIADESTQQLFADYVTERFNIIENNAPLPLEKVGYELDGKFLWVYQEVPLPEFR